MVSMIVKIAVLIVGTLGLAMVIVAATARGEVRRNDVITPRLR
jgi:hypothetical protein